MIPTISNLKMANVNVVCVKIKYVHLAAAVTETVIVIRDRPPKQEGKVTKSKPNVQDGPSIMPAKSHV